MVSHFEEIIKYAPQNHSNKEEFPQRNDTGGSPSFSKGIHIRTMTHSSPKETSDKLVQLTRPSEGTYLEQIAIEMGPLQFFAQMYAEYHTKSLVCSVGWNHVKFQTFYMLFRGLKENALSKNHFFCNLFYVQLCTDWTKFLSEKTRNLELYYTCI